MPVGYADGFRRDLTGTEVLVGGARRPGRRHDLDGCASRSSSTGRVEPGTPVTLIGDGLLAEEHAARLGTITYELVCGIDTSPARAQS